VENGPHADRLVDRETAESWCFRASCCLHGPVLVHPAHLCFCCLSISPSLFPSANHSLLEPLREKKGKENRGEEMQTGSTCSCVRMCTCACVCVVVCVHASVRVHMQLGSD
jgi:hypothetical protein